MTRPTTLRPAPSSGVAGRLPIIKAGGTPPPVNKGGRPKGVPQKVTPTVATMIFSMKAGSRPVAHIARELNLSRQTVYEVLRRA